MLSLVLLIILSVVLVMMIGLTIALHRQQEDAFKEKTAEVQSWLYAGIVVTLIAMISCVYFLLQGTIWQNHLAEWMNIIVRVMHVTFGIAWIGASFYFVFLENALNRTENVRDELAGNLWAVHGGGFYYLEKYKVAPREIPRHLHWFKYEAYFTWLSGFALLFVIYYFNASAMLIDKQVMLLQPGQAIAIGIGSFVIAWLLYDVMCRSTLRRHPLLFAIAGFFLLTAFAFFYAHIFSGRAAFIHFGAMMGTLMAGNVFFVIIPSQKAMVNAARKGQLPDAQKGKNALFRSIHNNYFTLPVLFVMVSNHFPSTFGNRYQWLVLAMLSLAAAGIKHWLNLREKGQLSVWILPVSIGVLLAVAYVTAPPAPGACKEVSFTAVNAIIQQRCTPCHSALPTDDIYKTPPNGVKFDTPGEITAKKDLIMQRVVLTKTMPQNNKTNMTPEERDMIRCWIEAGADTGTGSGSR